MHSNFIFVYFNRNLFLFGSLEKGTDVSVCVCVHVDVGGFTLFFGYISVDVL